MVSLLALYIAASRRDDRRLAGIARRLAPADLRRVARMGEGVCYFEASGRCYIRDALTGERMTGADGDCVSHEADRRKQAATSSKPAEELFTS